MGATAIHAPLLALTLFLVHRLATGRPWTRRMTTVSQLLSLAFGVVLWSSPTTYQPLVPVLGALQVTIVALLWVAPTSRRFFTTATPGPPRDTGRLGVRTASEAAERVGVGPDTRGGGQGWA